MEQKRRGRPPGSKNKKNTVSAGRRKTPEKSERPGMSSRLKDEIWAIVILALGAFLAVSLQTAAAGQFGIALGILLKGCFGHAAYILQYYLILYGFLLFGKRTAHIG